MRPTPQAGSLEAWSSGALRFEFDIGRAAITVAVELLRLNHLVHVMGRAETDDPRFRELFPLALASVEPYPVGSVARSPIAELGARMVKSFVDQAFTMIAKQLESIEAAKVAQTELLRLAAGGAGNESDPAVPLEGA
jgi:hypothetical protein